MKKILDCCCGSRMFYFDKENEEVEMKVLVACEESQRVCIAFREKGHEAYSCDVEYCSGGHPEWHIRTDVLRVLNGGVFVTEDNELHNIENWDLIIAHPPCTYMSKAGARFMYPTAGNIDNNRLKLALDAKDFFMKMLNAPCNKICVENPTPLKIIGLPPPTQVIQPYEYGHPYSKRTLLWLKNLPKLKPTNILKTFEPYLPSNVSGFARGEKGSRGVVHNAKDASKTFEGIAKAMAEQWG